MAKKILTTRKKVKSRKKASNLLPKRFARKPRGPLLVVVALLVMVSGITWWARSHAATTAFNPQIIPSSEPELVNPGRGANAWLNPGATEGTGWLPQGEKASVRYNRFTWAAFEKAEGVYDFSGLENLAQAAAATKAQASFRVMVSSGGASMPGYLFGRMPINTGPSGYLYPDWNNEYFLQRVEALYRALGQKYANDPRIEYLDISIYGHWAEWHQHGVDQDKDYKGKYWPTAATQRRLVDIQVKAFPNKLWSMLWGNNDVRPAVEHAMNYHVVHPETPPIGWRNDCFGTGQMNNMMNTYPFLRDRWKIAPNIAEGCSSSPANSTLGNYLQHTKDYHPVMIANANTVGSPSQFPASQIATVHQAFKLSGYRFELNQVTLPNPLAAGSPFTLTSQWSNVGVTPAYEPWDVTYQLRASAGSVVWEGKSGINFRSVLPTGGSRHNQNDTFTVPRSVPAGNYNVTVIVKDPVNYQNPLKLAIRGRQADGSYTLGQIALTSDGTNPEPPPGNILAGKIFTDSNGGALSPASNLTDGNTSTRWIGQPSATNVALTADLGASRAITSVAINWAADTTKNYDLQVSDDNAAWRTIASGTTNGTPSQLIDHTGLVNVSARYLRVLAKDLWNASYGHSIWEIEAYGPAANEPGDTDGDGQVNGVDLSKVLTNFGRTINGKINGDLTGDGKVDGNDLSQVLTNFGQ